MKKLNLFLVSAFMFSPFAVHAEKITAAVNYNPARMGYFDYLKVKDELGIHNKVQVGTLNLDGSGAEITLSGNGTSVEVGTLSGTGQISFPNATFTGGSTSYGDYSASSGAPGTAPSGTLEVLGGNVFAVGTLDNNRKDSYIKSLTNVGNLRIAAGTVRTPAMVYVLGDDSPTQRTFAQIGAMSADSQKDYGFVLGGINIPYPPKGFNYVWGKIELNGANYKILTLQKASGTTPPANCSNGATELCPDGVTIKKKCINGEWIFQNECTTPSDPDRGSKKYLTYAEKCMQYACSREGGCTTNLVPILGWSFKRPEKTRPDNENIRSVDISIGMLNYGNNSTLNNSCMPGQECDACEEGKYYVFADMDHNWAKSACRDVSYWSVDSCYKNSLASAGDVYRTIYSHELYHCVKRSTPPTPPTLAVDCSQIPADANGQVGVGVVDFATH